MVSNGDNCSKFCLVIKYLMEKKITMDWYNDPTVVAIEDPLYGTLLDKETFMEMYRSVLEFLDGKEHDGFTKYFTDYFEHSRLDNGIYVFREGERDNFIELCVAEVIFPTVKEIHAGET